MMSAKIRIILLCMICALMACLCACSSEESGGKIQSPEKLSDFLYYMYDKTNAPAWYSECTGGELSIHSGKADYEEELARQIDLFATRSRSDPKGDWITWHTSIYDIEARTLCVYSQEDYSIDYQFALTQ